MIVRIIMIFGCIILGITSLAGCKSDPEKTYTGTEQSPAAQAPAVPDQAPPPVVSGPDSGISGTAGQSAGARAQKRSDSWVTFKVTAALYANPVVDGKKFDVDTSNGIVTLQGMVNTEAGKATATQVAQNIEGVTRVENQMKVVPEAHQEMVEKKDDAIKSHIETMLDDAPYKDYDVKVDVNTGRVTLKGEVPSPAAAYQVIQVVRAVPGVRLIEDQMTLKSED